MSDALAPAPELFVAVGAIVRLTAADLVAVERSAQRSPRRRARFCAHTQRNDLLHEMLICLARDTYVRPHRHPGKSESFHIIRGELDVVLFHDDGAIREIIRMGPYSSGLAFFYRLSEPCYHTVVVKSEQVLFHETTNGPFDPAETDYAPWAPPEGDADCKAYLRSLCEGGRP
jgi:cupin fold WbuC family metalloprotein